MTGPRTNGGSGAPEPAAGAAGMALLETASPDGSHADVGTRPRVVVVGSGWRFTSGISYYTCSLTNALSQRWPTGVLLMRRLIPTALYPGRRRVGTQVNALDYEPQVDVYDGVDWFWGSTLVAAIDFLRRQRPDVVVFQWWTGAVLHSYAVLAWAARRSGARVVFEWHEVQDTGEARIPGVTRYVRAAMRGLLRLVDAHVVHSRHDLELLIRAYGLEPSTVQLIPHGPYAHVAQTPAATPPRPVATRASEATAGDDLDSARGHDEITVLYFGIIRPYKGLEYLIRAFDALPDDIAERMRLLVVGETWEGWDAPLEEIARSPRRERITVINRYVDDAQVSEVFAAADAVVLPYLRSSSSGPLAIAMSCGLPVVVSRVGGLVEAAQHYEGARFVRAADVDQLVDALTDLPARAGRRYEDVHSWADSTDRFAALFERLQLHAGARAGRTG